MAAPSRTLHSWLSTAPEPAGTAPTGRPVRRRRKPFAAAGVVAALALAGAGVLTPGSATADSLVTLSGTVTLGTTPAAGASISFGGVSTTADLSGHWAVHPFSGTSGTIEINDGVVHGSVPLTVGTNDQTENVNIPTGPATANVSVVDGNGNPLPGVQVDGSVPNVPDTVSDGQTTDSAPLTWGFTSIPNDGGLYDRLERHLLGQFAARPDRDPQRQRPVALQRPELPVDLRRE